jgi:glutaredoxin 3
MTDFLIYTIPHCPFCIKAKDLLTRKNFSFKEILFKNRDDEESLKAIEKLFQKTNGMRTFPQIFDLRNKQEKHIGGFTDLKAKFDKNEI